MVKVFNVAALVVKAYRVAVSSAYEVLVNEGHIIPAAVREVREALMASELPTELKALDVTLKATEKGKVPWFQEFEDEMSALG